MAEFKNLQALQDSSDLSEEVANQISVRLNGDMVIAADTIQRYKLLPFKMS